MIAKRWGLLVLGLSVVVSCGTPPPAEDPASTATVAAVETAPPLDHGPVPASPVPVSERDPSWGSPSAPVTMVELADFECVFCGLVRATLAELKGIYGPEKLRIVWKNLPLPFHDDARLGARAAMTAFALKGNDGFWQAHETLFDGNADLYTTANDLLGRLGSKDEVARASAAGERKIDEDEAFAKTAGASGTPSFFINGVFLSGAKKLETFQSVIDEQLRNAQALAKDGVPAAEIYPRLSSRAWVAPPPVEVKEKKDPLADKTIYKVPVGASPVRGNKDALVTIVEFSDFECPYCRVAHKRLHRLQKIYGDKLRLVFKHNPLPFHPRAEPAAQLALEARAKKGDEAFWKLHDMLFASPATADENPLDEAHLARFAGELGLDARASSEALSSHKHNKLIEADQRLAAELGAAGTPVFYVNGRRLIGTHPRVVFETLIDEQLAKAEALVKAGTRPAKLYATITAKE